METLELSYLSKWSSNLDNVKVEFKTARKLRAFINSGVKENLFYIKDKVGFFKIVRINKIMHTSIDAKIEKLTLREYNLERLGI